MPVIVGKADYPTEILKTLENAGNVIALDALSLAKQSGNMKAVNVVLIGVLAKSSGIAYEKWVDTIKTTVPEKFLEINLKAFDLGYNI
jgi:indolepyruvate ferredoxin oxidoreductase beta subunit